jgi:ABC-2 type transport system permease protein
VALVAGLWQVWVRQLGRSLTAPMTSGGGQTIGRGRLLPVLLGRSPTATIAARRVRAWYRDSRLVGIALRTAVLPVFFVLQAVLTSTHVFAGIGVVTLAVFAGLTLMNDLAFDGEAWWMHVATGVRGWEDRLGRALASTLVFGPMVLVTFVVSVALGVLTAVLPWLTVVVAAFLASLGLAVGVGAVLPGTAPRTGGNPFAATSGGAAQGCLTATISFVGPFVLTLPVVLLAVLTSSSGVGQWLALAVGTAYGVVLLTVGVLLGGRRLDRRAPEMLGQLAHAQL